MAAVRAGVIDVGANTARLLVAERKSRGLRVVLEERVRLALGEAIERGGSIPAAKLEELRTIATAQVEQARAVGCEAIEILVTSPGRQARNAEALRGALEPTGAVVRLLSGEEEALLAYVGAVEASGALPESIAVCDVGGGSTQVVVGTPSGGPAWFRSFDIGSLRLTSRMLADDPPGRRALQEASIEVERSLEALHPPLPHAALAAGGSARALRKLVGSRLGPEELAAAFELLERTPSARIAERFGLSPARARTLAGGALILSEIRRRVGVELHVSRAGLREGALRSLLAQSAAA
jgi:exopolyphosphatase / guanosine-5'-triphosphate,3'-diphosphate pyrophosphatase